jgi:hypothetical protein
MSNKSEFKNWNEANMAITAIAFTATLWFWNSLAAPNKAQAAPSIALTYAPPPNPLPTETAEPTPTALTLVSAEPTKAQLALVPKKVIYGGVIPQQQVVQVPTIAPLIAAPVVVQQVAPPVSTTKKKKGGGGGGSAAPAPAPSTGTS